MFEMRLDQANNLVSAKRYRGVRKARGARHKAHGKSFRSQKPLIRELVNSSKALSSLKSSGPEVRDQGSEISWRQTISYLTI